MTSPRPRHQTVYYRNYGKVFDLSGKDLISLLDHPKSEIAPLLGGLVPKTSMSIVQLPLRDVTSMSGEIVEEVHEFPEVTLGPRFRYLVLHFHEDRLIGFRWNFPEARAKHQAPPWYKRMLGR